MMNERDGAGESDLSQLADRIAQKVVDRLSIQFRGVQPAKNLVGRQEMARLAGMSVASIDRLVSGKKISSRTVGKRRLFDADQVFSELDHRPIDMDEA